MDLAQSMSSACYKSDTCKIKEGLACHLLFDICEICKSMLSAIASWFYSIVHCTVECFCATYNSLKSKVVCYISTNTERCV